MKKNWSIFLISVLCFITVLTAAAGARSYNVTETDLTIEIDDTRWYVFTRDNLQNNPEMDELGLTYDYMHGVMLENKAFVDAILIYEDGSVVEFFVMKVSDDQNKMVNLSNYDDDDVEDFADGVKEGVEQKNIKIDDYSVYESEYKFVKLDYKDSGYYILQYLTVVNKDVYTLGFQSEQPFTAAEREEFEEIVNSARFEIDTTLKEKNTSSNKGVLYYTIRGAIIGAAVGGASALIASIKKKRINKADAAAMNAAKVEAQGEPEPEAKPNDPEETKE